MTDEIEAPDGRSEEEKAVAQRKKGFGSNPHLINRSGRPLGSRNKSKLVKAQLKFDDFAELAVDRLKLIMLGDIDALGVREVPLSLQVSAAKVILDKAIANEKEKSTKSKSQQGTEAAATGPKVFASAAATKG